MKKLRLLVLLITLLFVPGYVFAADAMIVNMYYDSTKNMKVVKIDWVDSPALTLESQHTGVNDFLAGWYCFGAETVPGAAGAQPTNLYDIVISNAVGTDIFATRLTNRSNTANETALTEFNSALGPFPMKPVNDALTVTITGQSNALGTGTIYLYFARY